MAPDWLSAVGETAIGAAMMRAEESARPDRLFDDPYATAFVAAAPGAFADGPSEGEPEIAALEDQFCTHVAIRTRFYDDFLRRASGRGCRQVALLAAGLDTRAFRLSWPEGTRVFEVDFPSVLAFKDEVLRDRRARAQCGRIAVGVDLREGWTAPLVEAGFDRDASTAWTAEGLLAYLNDSEATHLLADVELLSSPGSELALEAGSIGEDSTLVRAREVLPMELWPGGMRESAATWLRSRGWDVIEHHRADLARTYGRPTSDASTGGFLTAMWTIAQT